MNVSACPTCEKSINYLKCRKSRSHVTSPTCFAESPTCDYVAFNVIDTPIRTRITFKVSGPPRDSRAESRRIKTSSHVEGSADDAFHYWDKKSPLSSTHISCSSRRRRWPSAERERRRAAGRRTSLGDAAPCPRTSPTCPARLSASPHQPTRPAAASRSAYSPPHPRRDA